MTLGELGRTVERRLVCARCEIETDRPLFPVHHEGKLIFPVGRFETALCTPELRLAHQEGLLLRVWDVCVYEGFELFTRYVNQLYKLRRRFQTEGNKPFSDIAKRLLNHLYGKWGQLQDEWEQIGDAPEAELGWETGYSLTLHKTITVRTLGGKIEQMTGRAESFNSFPAIAAHATSYARMRLLDAIEMAGWENVFYCDTDSLYVNLAGRDRLKPLTHPSALGKLKLEKTVQSFTINGPKDYVVDGHVTLKGVRRSAVRLGPNDFVQEHFPSLKAILKSPDPNIYPIKTVTKHLNRHYTKGVVEPSGRVVPLSLPLSRPQE
jgi:hypothetical protein